MNKVPISIIIDDPAPVISVYQAHCGSPVTMDGRPVLADVPNSFLATFCDIIERHGIKGKFSIVPMPANRGDIVNGLSGVDPSLVTEWLQMVRDRLVPHFTIGPEMLTHHRAVDLATGGSFDMNEQEWAATQDRNTLTPYIARALSLLKESDFDVFGVTSPWYFGIEVEDEYTASISQAVFDVTGKKNAWFFLRSLRNLPNAKPWVQYESDGRCLVAIPATTSDHMWASIDTPDTSDAFVNARADLLITADGKDGEIIRVLESGGYPILIAHWQSLVSNGLGTGMRILDEVGKRISSHLKDRVEWKSFSEIMEMVVSDKANYPKPIFK